MLKMQSQTIPHGRDEQIRLIPKGTGTEMYVDVRVWRRNQKKAWEPTDISQTVDVGELAAIYDHCEMLKKAKRKLLLNPQYPVQLGQARVQLEQRTTEWKAKVLEAIAQVMRLADTHKQSEVS